MAVKGRGLKAMKVLSQNVRKYITTGLGVLSSPQKVHCLVYLAGLIWLIKFRSIKTIAEEFGRGDTDGLHHFLRYSTRRSSQMMDASQNFVAAEIQGQDNVQLIIDDTTCPRDGEKIEGLGWHHSGDGLIKGLCAVTAVIRAAGRTWAWEVVGYVSRKSVSADVFRSKIQIALGIIDAARKKLKMSITVLIDSWYACAEILNAIAITGWTYIAAVKTNRIFIVDGKKTPVRNLAKGPRDYQTVRLSQKRIFRVARRIVILPKVGMVALFICKHHNVTRFFISNNLTLSCRQMVYQYDERFEIEFFHKDIKQHLGFGELFVRSRHCAQKHWTLVAIAYNLVLLMSRDPNSRSFRRKIERLRKHFPAQGFIKFKFVS